MPLLTLVSSHNFAGLNDDFPEFWKEQPESFQFLGKESLRKDNEFFKAEEILSYAVWGKTVVTDG